MKTLDTRDLYKRKCELEELCDAVTSAKEELEEAKTALQDHAFTNGGREMPPSYEEERESLANAVGDAQDALEYAELDFGTDEQEELTELENLENEITDFMHGTEMISESEFEEYARQLAEDIGAIPADMGWPCTCIDWEQAAEELKGDYTEVTYQGDTYLVRA